MNETIKAIETYYNGYRFRSRLEAKWAVFFDALGVDYEYEPEGFKLQNKECYLPDFKVKCHGVRGRSDEEPFDLFIEVKGNMSLKDANKIRLFSHNYPILIVDKIPDAGCATDSNNCGSYELMNGIDIYPFNYETIDGDNFAAYPAATKNGQFYLFGDDGHYINCEDESLVEEAYDKARQARFEFGEKPEVNHGTVN